MTAAHPGLLETAEAVRKGGTTARAAVQASLDRIAATEPRVNAFTAVLADRALRRADQIDRHAMRPRSINCRVSVSNISMRPRTRDRVATCGRYPRDRFRRRRSSTTWVKCRATRSGRSLAVST